MHLPHGRRPAGASAHFMYHDRNTNADGRLQVLTYKMRAIEKALQQEDEAAKTNPAS